MMRAFSQGKEGHAAVLALMLQRMPAGRCLRAGYSQWGSKDYKYTN